MNAPVSIPLSWVHFERSSSQKVRAGSTEGTKPPVINSPNGYRHQALDTSTQQIRLIKLHLNRDGPPACDRRIFELGSAPPFVALSYTWGPPSPQFDILVNGEPLSIRVNLFRFFKTYLLAAKRSWPLNPIKADYLWIDQICIDQSSISERNHQVGMMASIYSRCSGTIIWLGNFPDYPNAPLVLRNSKAHDYGSAIKPSEVSQALAAIAGNEYFDRLWIVQEVILSAQRRVLCSHHTAGPVWINWDRLCAEAKTYPQHISSTAAQYLLDNHDQENPMTLIYAIKAFIRNDCHNPRDKVYGLMGLVKEEQRLTIDYRKSLEEILLDTMIVLYADFIQGESRSYDEGLHALMDLGRNWDIMTKSLDAFLYDTWVKTAHDKRQGFSSEEYDYPHIRAMGTALNQSIKLQRKELLPWYTLSGPGSHNLELSEWMPTKDCWWYEVDDITYEIYGLISTTTRSDCRNIAAGYYGKRIRKTRR